MRLTDAVNTRADYAKPENREIGRVSAIVEAAGYTRWNRVEETIEFAHRMAFKRLGIAFCVGMREEAKILNAILKANGFEVVSAACKTGAIPKEELGLSDDQKVRPGTTEMMCNPIGQAHLLNEAQTEFNIIFGLCVGHDSLFIKHADALTTCLVAKDRALAHNPIGGIYCAWGYYRDRVYHQHRQEAAPGSSG
ncbi:MAG: DUF1847 domain-containing protein [Dehalococcoidales bacterium]|nr:DUF1847 domain-containing protein [Dehalococcoidales bacterium]